MAINRRISHARSSVTAPTRRQRELVHHVPLPEPRRLRIAGDANASFAPALERAIQAVKLRAPLLASSIVVIGSFLVLSAVLQQRIPSITNRIDAWLGTDIGRFTAVWMQGGHARFHLHPLPFAVYYAFGVLIRSLGLSPVDIPLPVLALPVVVFVTVCLQIGCSQLGSAYQMHRPIMTRSLIIVALLIGPAVAFLPVPESHMMGGALLFLEGALVLRVLRSGAGHGDRTSLVPHMRGALFAAILSTACTITNIVPAALLLAPMAAAAGLFTGRWKLYGGAALFVIVVVFALMLRVPVLMLLRHESGAMTTIGLRSIAESFLGLIIQQFGIPDLRTYGGDLLRSDLVRVVSVRSASLVSVLGLLAWIAALFQWWRARFQNAPERAFLLWAGLALGSLLLLHSIYASREAYLFSAHAWPVFALSTQVFLIDGLGYARRARLILPCLAVALSLLQSLLAVARVLT